MEQTAHEETDRVAQLEASLREAEARASAAERTRDIERALHGAGALDAETASMLVEREMASGEVEAEEAVERLRREKAWLFRPAQASEPAPSATGAPAQEGEGLHEAARRAAASGDRRRVLEYLRLRRGR